MQPAASAARSASSITSSRPSRAAECRGARAHSSGSPSGRPARRRPAGPPAPRQPLAGRQRIGAAIGPIAHLTTRPLPAQPQRKRTRVPRCLAPGLAADTPLALAGAWPAHPPCPQRREQRPHLGCRADRHLWASADSFMVRQPAAAAPRGAPQRPPRSTSCLAAEAPETEAQRALRQLGIAAQCAQHIGGLIAIGIAGRAGRERQLRQPHQQALALDAREGHVQDAGHAPGGMAIEQHPLDRSQAPPQSRAQPFECAPASARTLRAHSSQATPKPTI